LPPGRLAVPVINRIKPTVDGIAAHAQQVLAQAGQPGSLDVKVALPGGANGRTLSGTVPNVSGDVLHTVTYSRVNPRHRLAMWVRLLALTAAHPERPFQAVTIGRVTSDARNEGDVTIARIPPLGDTALAHLTTLVDLYDRGMREPLPIACVSSAAYARAAEDGKNAAAAARKEWQSQWSFDKEDKDLEHQLVLGGVRTFDDLLTAGPRTDEEGDGWDPSDPTRFGRYARRLWAGLLSVETMEHR
jgi:exodeoxyribonuclease V gamma subunit